MTEFDSVDWRGTCSFPLALTRIRLRATSHTTGFARRRAKNNRRGNCVRPLNVPRSLMAVYKSLGITEVLAGKALLNSSDAFTRIGVGRGDSESTARSARFHD